LLGDVALCQQKRLLRMCSSANEVANAEEHYIRPEKGKDIFHLRQVKEFLNAKIC